MTKGLEVEYFPIDGKGILAYLKNIFILCRYRKNKSYDIFHSHYALSGIVASLAGCKPLVASLMGSDIYEFKTLRLIIRVFAKLFWKKVIVKSGDMADRMHPVSVEILPNGVNLKVFKPSERTVQNQTSVNPGKKVIFVANPLRKEKNIQLAKKSIEILGDPDLKFIAIHGKSQAELCEYYNASDVLLLTSLWEGSPNVVKEAMACNCPIVSTEVGDVKWVVGQTDGCYITGKDPVEIAEKIRTALYFGRRTRGRDRIMKLQLDSESIATKLLNIYSAVLEKG